MTIFGLILRVLLCAVGIYFVAAFVTSLTRLLPFLTLGTSIALIFTIRSVVESGEVRDKIWILIVLSIAMVLFHRGTDYMEPHVVTNVFGVVDVRRKWVSLFASDDEYVIYLAPKEIGGFFENTFFLGIFYYFHYAVIASPYASWVVYIPAIYYLGMAVVEILVVLGHAVGLFSDFPTLLYWIARVAVIITAIVIGVTGGGTSTEQRDRKWEKRAKELYEQCVSLVQLDFTRSYELATDSRSLGGDFTPTWFLYDADKNAGGLYRDNADGEEFYTVFASDPRLGGYARFKLDEENEGKYLFDKLVTKTDGHPRPFDPESYDTYTEYDIASLCEFTHHKVLSAMQVQQHDTDSPLQILYASRHDNTTESPVDYQVAFYFNTDEEGVPVSLRSICCEIYRGDSVLDFNYYPLKNETALDALFDPVNKTLKGYEAGSGSGGGEELRTFHEQVEQAVKGAMDAARYSVGQFDFRLLMTVKNRQGKKTAEALYAYDAGVQVTAKYNEESFESSLALDGNDFKTYPPATFISNPHRTMYDGSSYAPLPDNGPFARFTGDDAVTAEAIRYSFDADYYFYPNDVEVNEDGSIVVYVKADGGDIHGTTYFTGTGYRVRLEDRDGVFAVTAISVYFEYDERDNNDWLINTWYFDMLLFIEDCYHIPAP